MMLFTASSPLPTPEPEMPEPPLPPIKPPPSENPVPVREPPTVSPFSGSLHPPA